MNEENEKRIADLEQRIADLEQRVKRLDTDYPPQTTPGLRMTQGTQRAYGNGY